MFDDSDLARVKLLAELRNDLGVNEDAIPVVLRLLDQVYSLRRALADLNEAIRTLPEQAQDKHRANLAGEPERPGRRYCTSGLARGPPPHGVGKSLCRE